MVDKRNKLRESRKLIVIDVVDAKFLTFRRFIDDLPRDRRNARVQTGLLLPIIKANYGRPVTKESCNYQASQNGSWTASKSFILNNIYLFCTGSRHTLDRNPATKAIAARCGELYQPTLSHTLARQANRQQAGGWRRKVTKTDCPGVRGQLTEIEYIPGCFW